MKKLFKILLISLLAIISLLLITIVVLPFIINPNDYKPQIIELVKEQTGRTLKIPGQIDLSVFPWLGIRLGAIELSNAQGFGNQPFAKIDKVDVRVQLLPLLKKDVQIGRVELDGLKLNLQQDQSGKTNWDDLVKSTKKTAKKSTTPQTTTTTDKKLVLAGLAIGGIHIQNAQLNWHDKQNNQSMVVKSLNLQADAITAGQPVALKLSTNFAGNNPDVQGKLELTTSALINPQQQLYTLNDLELNAQLHGTDLPNNKLALQLNNGSLIFSQEKQTLNLKNLQLKMLGVQLYADAKVTQLNKQPRYQVNLASDAFSARSVAEQLGINLPTSADKQALSKVKLSTKLTGGMNSVSINPFSLQLDDSSLNGDIQVSNFAQPALRYSLALDAIDVDRYLPPGTSVTNKKTAKPAATPATAVAASTSVLPVKQLRTLNVKGDLIIGQLKASGVRSEKIQITTNAKDGLIHLYPLKANMYQGHYKGDVRINVQGKTPVISMNESLSNINIGPLLKDLWGKNKVEGIANLNAKLTARGNDPVSFRKTLTGNANFKFENGIVKGINLGAYQRALNALIAGKQAPQETGPDQTEFADIKGSLQIINGLASNKDLTATLPYARIQGNGFAHLAKEVVDYTVYSKFTSEVDIKQGKSYAQINKPPLPVLIKGPLTQPKITVDYKSVLKALAKKKLDKKKAAAKAKVQQKIDQKKDEQKKKLEDKLKDKLKNLLKF